VSHTERTNLRAWGWLASQATVRSDSCGVTSTLGLGVVRDSGLPYELNAMFTLVEGEWDEVMDVVRRAVEAASVGATRTSLVLKADIRPGHTNQLRAKVDRITQHLAD
jgi:uncharacterized protein YqgV (UPF0045/DUF77 family)